MVFFSSNTPSLNLPESMQWFDRKFSFDLPLWMGPNIVERLRGTPARVEDRLQGVPASKLVHKTGNQWTIQEHVGHLLDLEPLWSGRVEDMYNGVEELRAADLENKKTYQADHNARPMVFLLAAFRKQRAALIERLDNMKEDDFALSARHPRLVQPMRMMDLLFFTAEHDDHHLASITHLMIHQ